MAFALLAASVALADGQADRDSKEVSNYVLTEAGLAKYTQAAHSMKPLLDKSPEACKEDSESAKSLDQMAAKLNAVPGAKAAMQAAGISAREYMVFSMSLVQNAMAAWALDQPGGKLPPGVQMANVKFYRAHEAALKKLGEETKSGGCKEDDRQDDSGE
jgi:hypothetical protein